MLITIFISALFSVYLKCLSLQQLFTNTSIQAILFGIAFLFLSLFLFTSKTKALTRYILYFAIAVLAAYIIILNSRIVWLGIVTVWAIIYLVLGQPKNKALLYAVFCCCFIATIVRLLFYKQGSTFGRIFIYKINYQIIKTHWLFGIHQPYNIVFNHTQANYFQGFNASLSEQLLASNGFFVFNEWLSAFIHFGIFGFVISIFTTVLLVKQCLKQLKMFPKKAPVIGAVFLLLVTALVSYPFSFGLYNCIFICSVIYILKDTNWWSFKANKKVVAICLYSTVCIVIGYKAIIDFRVETNIKKATDLYKTGYINNALAIALQQSQLVKNNGELYYLVSKIYFQKNKIDSSIAYLQLAHNYLCTDELHLFWGNCLNEVKLFSTANSHFQLAVNIMPCKFQNRVALIKSCSQLKDYKQALVIARETIDLPEKIPSIRSSNYKQEAINLYNAILITDNIE